MRKVFLSIADDDLKLLHAKPSQIKEVIDTVNEHQGQLQIFYYHEALHMGEEYRSQLRQNLQNADVLLFVPLQNYIRSEACLRELAHFLLYRELEPQQSRIAIPFFTVDSLSQDTKGWKKKEKLLWTQIKRLQGFKCESSDLLGNLKESIRQISEQFQESSKFRVLSDATDMACRHILERIGDVARQVKQNSSQTTSSWDGLRALGALSEFERGVYALSSSKHISFIKETELSISNTQLRLLQTQWVGVETAIEICINAVLDDAWYREPDEFFIFLATGMQSLAGVLGELRSRPGYEIFTGDNLHQHLDDRINKFSAGMLDTCRIMFSINQDS